MQTPDEPKLTHAERRKLYMRAYGKIYYQEQKEANTEYYQKSLEAGRIRYHKIKEGLLKEANPEAEIPPKKVFKKRNIQI